MKANQILVPGVQTGAAEAGLCSARGPAIAACLLRAPPPRAVTRVCLPRSVVRATLRAPSPALCFREKLAGSWREPRVLEQAEPWEDRWSGVYGCDVDMRVWQTRCVRSLWGPRQRSLCTPHARASTRTQCRARPMHAQVPPLAAIHCPSHLCVCDNISQRGPFHHNVTEISMS